MRRPAYITDSGAQPGRLFETVGDNNVDSAICTVIVKISAVCGRAENAGTRWRTPLAAAVLAWAVLLLLNPVHTYAQTPRQRVTYTEVSKNLVNVVPYIGFEKGFFAEQGLDVAWATSGRRDLSMLSLISGETQFVALDPAETALARAKGAKVKIVAPVIVGMPIYIVVPESSPVRSVKELKGKTVATATAPIPSYSALQSLFTKNGFVEVAKDQWRPAGSSADRDTINVVQVALGNEIALIKAGRADAANVQPPFEAVAAKTLNTRILYRYATEGEFLFNVISVMEDTIQRDPGLVQRFVNAMANTYCFIKQNPDEATKIAGKYIERLEPDVVSAAFRQMLTDRAFPKSPMISHEAFDNNFSKLLVETKHPAAGTKFDDVMDLSFAQKAEAQYGCN